MTDDLAFDLRGFARELFHGRQVDQYATDRILEAADRLEALEAEIERLREALKVTHNLAVTYAVGSGTLFYEAMAEARAALGEK